MGTDTKHTREDCRNEMVADYERLARHGVLSKFFVNDIVACYVPCAGIYDKSPDNVANRAEFTRIFFSLSKKNLTHLNRATSAHDLHGDKLRTFASYSVASSAPGRRILNQKWNARRYAVLLKNFPAELFSNFADLRVSSDTAIVTGERGKKWGMEMNGRYAIFVLCGKPSRRANVVNG